jgi:hypothetical protein
MIKKEKIKVEITNLDILSQLENKKIRFNSKLYKSKVKIIPYLMTWERLVTKLHKKHRNQIGIASKNKHTYNTSNVEIAFPSNEDKVLKDGHNDSLVSKIVQI